MGRNAVRVGEVGRQAERVAVDGAARLRPNSWSSVEATMLDLSPLGFRARCEARLQPGGGISVDIPGIGSVDAQVEWRRDGEFGARFFAPIEIERCEWTLSESRNPLAQLLVARAEAHKAGRAGAERQIRHQILRGLPMRKGEAAP